MKLTISGLFFSLLLLSFSAIAQREPTREEDVFFTKAMSQINAKHVRWIKSTAGDANEKNLTPEDVQNKAKSYGLLGGMNGQDIEAIAFLVLMQASKSAQEDLKSIMAQVKGINDQKSKIREALSALEDKRNPITRNRLDSFRLLLKPEPNVQRNKNISSSRSVTQIEIDETRTRLSDQRDSLAELGEEQQLKMQLLMDRRSKIMTTLSNLMKKIAGTQDSIIANLK